MTMLLVHFTSKNKIVTLICYKLLLKYYIFYSPFSCYSINFYQLNVSLFFFTVFEPSLLITHFVIPVTASTKLKEFIQPKLTNIEFTQKHLFL